MGFKLKRISDTEMDVETPIPVSRNVWDFFVLGELNLIGVDPSLSPRTISGNPANTRELYVNRVKSQEESEIADGQIADYWGHAFLPAGERTPINKGQLGKIFVPSQQPFYLDQIAGDLRKNRGERRGLLLSLSDMERNTVKGLFEVFARSSVIFYGDDETHLAETFRRNIIGAIGKSFDIKLNYGDIGRLPAYLQGPENNLRNQVGLDFLRQLDSHLKPDETLDGGKYIGLSAKMYRDYVHILGV